MSNVKEKNPTNSSGFCIDDGARDPSPELLQKEGEYYFVDSAEFF